jgi:hypothetical protein
VAAVETEDGEGREVAQRIARNQALVRGSPIAGRAFVGAGAAAMAAGLRQRYRKPRTFHLSTRKEFKTRQRKGFARGSQGKYWSRSMEKTYVFRRTGFGAKQIDVQKARVRKQNLKPTTRSRAMTGAGKIMIVGGKALPTLAYGYIGYDIMSRRSAGHDVDVKAELETATFGMSSGEMLATAADLYTQAEITYQVSKTVVEIVSAHL